MGSRAPLEQLRLVSGKRENLAAETSPRHPFTQWTFALREHVPWISRPSRAGSAEPCRRRWAVLPRSTMPSAGVGHRKVALGVPDLLPNSGSVPMGLGEPYRDLPCKFRILLWAASRSPGKHDRSVAARASWLSAGERGQVNKTSTIWTFYRRGGYLADEGVDFGAVFEPSQEKGECKL